MKQIYSDKIFYHIYPLGLSGAPQKNDFSSPKGDFFEKLTQDLDRIKSLGVNALYIGPIFESTAHGYDTVDYYHVERRLGNNESFKEFSKICHQKGIKIVLDAVFNHTGRDFFAFKDLIQNGINSQYKDWYLNINFEGRSQYNDPFDYEGWAGCKDLVKLNLENPQVIEHLLSAVKFWKEEFQIDGLRLDAADVISKNFLDTLGNFCRKIDPDFWLMGEVVHGDYNEWAKEGRIDSVTNYQIYKALWSALNEQNLYELSYNLNREFGPQGIYRYAPLYNFVDNHDVDRIGSVIKEQRHLYLLYGLLFTIPGIPSIYYGSENAIQGKRNSQGDRELRPSLPPFNPMPDFAKPSIEAKDLFQNIQRFSKIRTENPCLQTGDYQELSITNTSFAFLRKEQNPKTSFPQEAIIMVNSSFQEQKLQIQNQDGTWEDTLNGGTFNGNELSSISVSPAWLRILIRKS